MKKRKVISIITALGLMASAVPSALAASSKYHTTRRDSYGNEYYIDSYDNKIYDDYIITSEGQKIWLGYNDGVEFDSRDNAIIVENSYDNYDYMYNNNFEYNSQQGLYDYLDYLDQHLNIDIAPENLDAFLQSHTRNCTDQRCRTGYALYQNYFKDLSNSNEVNNNIISPSDQILQQSSDILYTLVKDGVYAYSKVPDVSIYGLYGWTCNSIYNENDYNLNPVFFEEINTFGNHIEYNYDIISKINNNTDMYVWTYNIDGIDYWCVSPSKNPYDINNAIANYTNVRFNLVGEYGVIDLSVPLKTSAQVLNSLGLELDMSPYDAPQFNYYGQTRSYQR